MTRLAGFHFQVRWLATLHKGGSFLRALNMARFSHLLNFCFKHYHEDRYCSKWSGHILSLPMCHCPTVALGMHTREAVSDAYAALLGARCLVLPGCACKVPQGAAWLALAGIIADVESLSVAHAADC